MYVLENNNIVINGPRVWNYHSFEATLEDDLEIITKLPLKKEDHEIITINENTHIYKAELISPEYNCNFEYLNGPIWEFTTGIAVGTYVKENYDIDTIKGKLKNIVTANRYQKEISGITATIQGINITIDTSRDGRNIFVQKFVLMNDTDSVEWKFPESWLTLSKIELGEIISIGASYIQSQFDWEKNKLLEIETLQTIDELKLVDLG